MEDLELKVGDLVRLRDDLEDGKKYGNEYFVIDMKFIEFKKVESLNDMTKSARIKPNNSGYSYNYTKEMIAEVKRPKYETIYKREEPILDYKEKEYLGNLIRPFRNRVICIVKKDDFSDEYITILVKYDDTIFLPSFKKDTMYKNMKVDKEYILEELGL